MPVPPAGVFLIAVACAPVARAALDVYPPVAITRRVLVQPIVSVNAAGQSATFLGDPRGEAYVKGQINAVWAQAGVRVDWLPPVTYANGFVYDGSPGNFATVPRPGLVHMAAITDNTGTPPKHADPTVVNVFFVRIAPAFALSDTYHANGYAWIDENGAAVYVGGGLLTFEDGRDVVASVIAHEIGHNLGLAHTASGGADLMSLGRSADRLTASQRATIMVDHPWTDGCDFLHPLPPQTQFSQWALALGLTGGPADDDDADGLANGIEFLLGLNGARADALPLPTQGPNGMTWALRKSATAVADGFTCAVEVSADDQRWVAAGSPGSGATVVEETANSLVIRVARTVSSAMLRLSVDLPAPPPLAAPARAAAAEGKSANPARTGCPCHAR